MTSLWLDLRYALRTMAKAPGLTAVLVITLALGIGATTTIFSVVNSVILRPLPYREPDRLARLYTEITGKVGLPHVGLLTLQVRDLRHDCRTCAAVAAWRDASPSLAGGDRPVRVHAIYATHELLPLLGVQPALGRWFDAGEDHPGDPQVVVLSHDVWQRVFNGDPGVIGKQVQLDAVTVTIIGVMPAGFRFPESTEIWAPSQTDFSQDDGASFNFDAVARLAPGASLAALADELDRLSRRWTDWINVIAAQVGYPSVTLRTHAVSFHADLVGSVSTALWLLQAAVLFVLLIGLRVALGARPGQVRAMVLRQAAALVVAGVAIGLAAAIALSVALGGSLRELFYGEPLAQPALLAAVAIAVMLTALLATWIPVRRATEVQPTVALRTE